MAIRERSIGKMVSALAAVIVTTCLVLALLRPVAWPYPLELVSHFQLQYLIAAAAGTAALAGLRRWRWAGVGLAAMVAAGSVVLPWHFNSGAGEARATTAAAQPPGTFRLFDANVLASNDRHDLLLAAIEAADPDVIVLQEVTASWMSALAPLSREYPYSADGEREDNFGIAVFSRIPLEGATLPVLGSAGLPSVSFTLRVAGTPVSVLATHPVPPLPLRRFKLRNEQLQDVAAFLEGRPRPLIVAGDLNATMWTPWLKELQDGAGLVNARRGRGVLPSWPTFLPGPMRIPIDHCLHSPDLSVAACRLGPSIGSDHLPLVVDFLVPARAFEQ